MFWKIYSKVAGVLVDKVWYPNEVEWHVVYDLESENHDFDILVKSDSED